MLRLFSPPCMILYQGLEKHTPSKCPQVSCILDLSGYTKLVRHCGYMMGKSLDSIYWLFHQQGSGSSGCVLLPFVPNLAPPGFFDPSDSMSFLPSGIARESPNVSIAPGLNPLLHFNTESVRLQEKF